MCDYRHKLFRSPIFLPSQSQATELKMSIISNITYLCVLLIALSSWSATAFTGSQGLNSHPSMNRAPSIGKSLSASKSYGVTTMPHPMDYADQYYGPVHTQAATREANPLSRIIPSQLSNLFQFDKSKAASMGVSFAMTYNFISNINGSITLSAAWYIASIRVSFIVSRIFGTFR